VDETTYVAQHDSWTIQVDANPDELHARFAVAAMQTLLSRDSASVTDLQILAARAFDVADAMMREYWNRACPTRKDSARR
jgi:hypothetical protein